MFPYQDLEDLAINTAVLFEEEEIYSIAVDYGRPYPRKYVPFCLSDAVIEAMLRADYGPDEIGRNFSLRAEVEKEAKKLVDNWYGITLGRAATAHILNQYSPTG